MKFIRYKNKRDPISYGWIKDEQVGQITGDLFGEFRRQEAHLPIEDVHLLAPVLPGKIIGVGRNYEEHATEQGVEIPDIPIIFFKPPSSVIGMEEEIVIPPQSREVVHEAELALIIGKSGRWIKPEDSFGHIFGYTIGNDVTARDLQRRDSQWTRGKGFDTFCSLGPWIETDMDPSDALITCKVNDELRQMASTREMVFSIQQLIVYISSIMTLEPGDVILTGTPAGSGPLKNGDKVEITIDGIGALINRVVEGK
jgi:2-keto-4-pentenoate hydratase/2-oxohepta-3-ene-1,7-dioic acid hydratase in catechol pathway